MSETRRMSLETELASRAASVVHVAIPDVDGALRERRLPLDSLARFVAEGASFCNVLHEWDVADTVHGRGPFVSEPIALDGGSVRRYPFEPEAVWMLADFTGPHAATSPRELLKAQLARAARLGFGVQAAFEFEWLVFEEAASSLRAKRYENLAAWAPDNRCWDALSAAQNAEAVADLHALLDEAEVPVFGLGMELGAGCLEATLQAREALRAADDAMFFKLVTKAAFRRRGQTACFMAQADANAPGLSGHLSLSLEDYAGNNVFEAPQPETLGPTARHLIGGVLALLPELIALPLHTANAYRRLSPGNWAPRTASWSFGGYTTAIRAVAAPGTRARLEFRIPGADVNPYLGLAMFLAAGLWGIEQACEPPEPTRGDGREAGTALPRDLLAAAEALAGSGRARTLFGDVFVDHFSASRRHEFDTLRRAVSAAEKARYFEVA